MYIEDHDPRFAIGMVAFGPSSGLCFDHPKGSRPKAINNQKRPDLIYKTAVSGHQCRQNSSSAQQAIQPEHIHRPQKLSLQGDGAPQSLGTALLGAGLLNRGGLPGPPTPVISMARSFDVNVSCFSVAAVSGLPTRDVVDVNNYIAVKLPSQAAD